MLLRLITKIFVGAGTATTVSSTTYGLQKAFVKRSDNKAVRALEAVSLTAARWAITFKATDTMNDYVDEFFDKEEKEYQDFMNDLHDIRRKAIERATSKKTEKESDENAGTEETTTKSTDTSTTGC